MLTPLPSAMLGAAILRVAFGSTSFGADYLVWWIGDWVGILVVAPLVWSVLLRKWESLAQLSSGRHLELVLCFASIYLMTDFVCGGQYKAFTYSYMLIPLLLWPALRFGTPSVAAAVGMIAFILIFNTANGRGPFSQTDLSAHERTLVVQWFVIVAAAPFMALAAIMHERRRGEEEMEQRIEERTRALAEADRNKNHFLAVLAHELRNPLAPLSHALQAWPEISASPHLLEETRQLMHAQVQHMVVLIDDLLDVSRIAGGKLQLRKSHFDLTLAIRAATQSVHSLIEQNSQQLVLLLPEAPVAVEADQARLTQVVGNLVHNAVKYSGRGGTITVSVELQASDVKIRVRDNGPGIPTHELERIFDLFAQVDQTLERSHGGLGIGLTLVKNIVEMHGGRVEALSEGLGRGCEFCVTLNRLPQHTRLPGTAPVDGQAVGLGSRLPQHRILLVDDAVASAKMLAIMLRSLGQQVELRHDGPAALEAIHALQPTLVLLDIAMPGMTGYEVAERVRANPATRHVPLVAMTGYGQESDRQAAFAAGFDEHMVKPAKMDALTALLARTPTTSPAPSLEPALSATDSPA
jgi:signal transduction histidine kinase/ActR/RegA family two-component response regulator